MKKYFFLFTLMVLSASVFAQDTPETTETLLSSKVKLSGFGGPLVEFGSLDDRFAVAIGGGGAVLFNQRFFFGGYGLGVTNRISSTRQLYPGRYYLTMGHGGFWLGYNVNPHKLLHLTTSVKLGWGGVSINEENIILI